METSFSKTRERLQVALALLETKPDEAIKKIWKIFKEIKKPEVRSVKVVVHDRQREETLTLEAQQLRDSLRQKDFQVKQLHLELERERQKTKQFARQPGYDVQMIRDFLRHLEWELRTMHFEHTAPPGTIKRELCEEFEEFLLKYHTPALVADPYLAAEDNMSQEQKDRAKVYFRAAVAALMEQRLGLLTSLQDLFAEALVCAEKKKVVAKIIYAKDVLPPEEGGNLRT